MDRRPETRSRPRYRGALGLWLTLAALPAAAQIAPLTYQNLFFDQASNAHSGNYLAADAGLFYTDNASFGANGSGDTLAELGLVGNTAEDGPRLSYHLVSDIAVVRYLHGSFPTEPTGYLDGRADLKIVPGFFSWIARETYTQLQIDPFTPLTPDNLENVNYLTTGPRFTLRPTLRTTVVLEGVYSYTDSKAPSGSPEFVNIGNHRYGGDLKIERALSSTASTYIKGSYDKVNFVDQLNNNNFNVAKGVAGYHLVDGRTDLDISGGYTRVRAFDVPVTLESDIGVIERSQTETFGAANWALRLSRLITPSQRVALTASQQLLDATELFQSGFDAPVPTIVPQQLAVGDPLLNREFGADWRFQASRTSLDVGILDTRQRFRLTSLDNRDLKDASALLARQLSAVLNWDIGVHFEHQDLTSGESFNAVQEITSLRWQIGERLRLRFIYAHSTYNGINDNQAGMTVSYGLIRGTQPETPLPLQPISPMSTQPPLR